MSVDVPTPSFRWRIIPAWFLMGMGGLTLLGGTLGFFSLLWMLHQSGSVPPGGLPPALAGLGLLQAASLCLIAAGRLTMGRRWGWMALALLIAYAASVYGVKLMEQSRAPAADQRIAPA